VGRVYSMDNWTFEWAREGLLEISSQSQSAMQFKTYEFLISLIFPLTFRETMIGHG
jgi:hypothetical protein